MTQFDLNVYHIPSKTERERVMERDGTRERKRKTPTFSHCMNLF